MANRLFLLLAVAGLAVGQYRPSPLPPVQPPPRQSAADPSWQRTPHSWMPAFASQPADRIVFPHSGPSHVRQQCTAVSARVDLVSGVDDQVSGAVFFYQECPTHPVLITGRISGLTPLSKHGLHVHEFPNLTDKCSGAGGHYNPFKRNHGAQTNTANDRHVGDLGNIEANYEGVAEVHITDKIISLFPGERDIFRRAIVVHSGEDDLGLGGNEGSLKTGNAGMRLACGVIAPNNSPQCQ